MFKIVWTPAWAYDCNNWRLCAVFLDGTSLKVVLRLMIIMTLGVTECTGRATAAPRGGRTGGRTGRGGGRTGGRSGDQGDGRHDGQGGQVGGQGREVNDDVDGVPDFSTIIA
ncbi:hypothetical protein Tco_1141846 [Tanacetum coccineum]